MENNTIKPSNIKTIFHPKFGHNLQQCCNNIYSNNYYLLHNQIIYLNEAHIASDGLTDIEDVGILVQNNQKTIHCLQERKAEMAS